MARNKVLLLHFDEYVKFLSFMVKYVIRTQVLNIIKITIESLIQAKTSLNYILVNMWLHTLLTLM